MAAFFGNQNLFKWVLEWQQASHLFNWLSKAKQASVRCERESIKWHRTHTQICTMDRNEWERESIVNKAQAVSCKWHKFTNICTDVYEYIRPIYEMRHAIASRRRKWICFRELISSLSYISYSSDMGLLWEYFIVNTIYWNYNK